MLCFKYLLKVFPSLCEAGGYLEILWKFFSYCPITKNLLEEAAELCQENVVTPVALNITPIPEKNVEESKEIQ